MPVYEIPIPEKKPEAPKAEITPPSYKHSIVDSKKTPIEAPAAWIGGSNWYVDYYMQNHGAEEESNPFDPDKHIAYQSYNKINRMILKLQGALSIEDLIDNGRMSATGTALVPPNPGIIPEEHDVLIADIGEGTAGQFTVDSVRKLSLNAATAYEITFRLARVATQKITEQLDAKVVENYYFRRDSLILGQNPLLIDRDFQATVSLEEYYDQIAALWSASNMSYTHNTWILPNQPQPIYDPYVVRAMLRLMSARQHPTIKNVVEYNCDDYRIPKYDDIYSAVMKRSAHLIYRCFQKYQTINYLALNANPLQNSIRWSGLEYGIIPSTANLDADNYSNLFNLPGVGGPSIATTGGTLTGYTSLQCWADPSIPCEIADKGNTTSDSTQPGGADNNPDYGLIGQPGMDIPSIGSPWYVLSEAFYNRKLSSCTKFERILWDILDGKQTNYQDVFPFCQDFTKWGRLEQFYLGPFLLMMIRNASRSI